MAGEGVRSLHKFQPGQNASRGSSVPAMAVTDASHTLQCLRLMRITPQMRTCGG